MIARLKNIYKKITNYGFKKNTNDWDCGPIALYNLSVILNKNLSYKQCVELTSTKKDVGCLVYDFKETLDRLNLPHITISKETCRHLIDTRKWTGSTLLMVICYENKFKDRHMLVYYNDGARETLLNDKDTVISQVTPKRIRFLVKNSIKILLIGV